MSYDLRVAIKTTSGEYVDVNWPDRYSPTYNLGEMFTACTGWDFEQSKYYNAEKVEPLILHGIRELVIHEDDYRQYDAPNGWGTTETALKDLMSLYKCIHETSEERDVPLNELWVSW